MSKLKQLLSITCRMVIVALLVSSCIKNEFVEPPDPFEKDRLEEDILCFDFGNGIDSFKILTNADNVTYTDKGNLRIRGTIFADRDTLAPVRLSQGDFILLKTLEPGQKSIHTEEYGELPVSKGQYNVSCGVANTTQFEGFGGYAEFTLPTVGLIQDMEIPLVDGSPIGFAQGSELAPDFPVHPDRTYFYFYYGEQAEFLIGQCTFAVTRMALDPDDPYFYVHAVGMDIPLLGVVEEGGFAVSVEGYIPFTVPGELSFGHVENFDNGNILVEASINLEDFGVPITIQDATAVIAFGQDPETGRSFFNGDQVPFMIGLKGGFELAIHDLASYELGVAAVSLNILGYDNFRFSFAGRYSDDVNIYQPMIDLIGIGEDLKVWDFIQPPGQHMQFEVWGTIGSSIEDWMFGLRAESYFEIPNIMTINLGKAAFEISKDRLYFDCSMRMSFFGHVGFEGDIHSDGAFRLKAYTYEDESFDLKILEIDVGYSAHFEVAADAAGNWYFEVHGRAYLDISIGQPWMELHGTPELKAMNDPRVKASVSFTGRLNSSGKFRCTIKFSFAGIGYKYTFSFNLKGSEPTAFESLEEIPLDEVPLENRFQIIDYN